MIISRTKIFYFGLIREKERENIQYSLCAFIKIYFSFIVFFSFFFFFIIKYFLNLLFIDLDLFIVQKEPLVTTSNACMNFYSNSVRDIFNNFNII